jgi:selenocysteine-specific elongation factor
MQWLRALLAPKKGVQFAVPEFKDWTGISRKYAIPLLEYLDREHVTKREGDSRVIL